MPKTIFISTTDLTREKRKTYLVDDVAFAASTIRVQSIIGFENPTTSSGQIVCIGEIGNERTEIRRTSQTDYPSQTYKDITLRDTLLFDHPQDTPIYIIDWDRAEVRWAVTVNGTKATVAAYPFNITPDLPEMLYVDRSATDGYFFTRFNNTINSDNSDYSDAVPFGGYDDNTVFMIKKRAIESLGEEIDGKTVTHEFLNQALWEARREYHEAPGKRPFRRLFNSDIGDVSTGMYRVDLPTTVERPWTAENIYGMRIGTSANLRYYDKKEWDFNFRNIGHSTLTSAYTVGARDLYVASARDFTNSGVVSIAQTNVEYSAKSNTGGTLRISVQGSYNVANAADVWQNATYGLPTKFTVWADPEGSAFIYFNMPVDTAYVGQNIYSDFYRRIVGYDSDADVLDEPNYDMFEYFLKAKIKERRSKGTLDITQDSDYKIWRAKKLESLSRETVSTDISMIPDIEHLPIPN